MPPRILVICGPTATGKTGLAVLLAQARGGEVVSADSMQIYRGMDIGTAKPTRAEMRGVPHHMLDVADPAEEYSVARYVDEASACIDDILARGKRPIVAGGTGLYIDSLVAGRRFAAFSGHWRTRLAEELAQHGIGPLHERLRAVDPERAALLHSADHKRILRALEVWHETGKPLTAHDRESKAAPPRYEAVTLALSYQNRDRLNQRIDRRVDDMMAAGLEGEVRALLARGLPPGATAMQAIGYKELTNAMERGLPTAVAVEEIKLRSRQYAKRQLTWFRRNEKARWILWENGPDFSAAVQDSTAYLEGCGL